MIITMKDEFAVATVRLNLTDHHHLVKGLRFLCNICSRGVEKALSLPKNPNRQYMHSLVVRKVCFLVVVDARHQNANYFLFRVAVVGFCGICLIS